MTSPICLTLPDGTVISTDMICCALNSDNWDIGSYLLDKYHGHSSLTFTKKLSIEPKYKLSEHQTNGRESIANYAPQFQIALEYYAEELDTKEAMDFVLNYFSKRLRMV